MPQRQGEGETKRQGEEEKRMRKARISLFPPLFVFPSMRLRWLKIDRYAPSQ
jgi:hypothetical protein